jgi:hypothetical protein
VAATEAVVGVLLLLLLLLLGGDSQRLLEVWRQLVMGRIAASWAITALRCMTFGLLPVSAAAITIRLMIIIILMVLAVAGCGVPGR